MPSYSVCHVAVHIRGVGIETGRGLFSLVLTNLNFAVGWLSHGDGPSNRAHSGRSVTHIPGSIERGFTETRLRSP